ncbi:carcinoembryonic antigen-related cell adhesion molecule 1-like [Pelobates fuscus]|uniref:carcinoembryonic antigen-related cell adhesion molecule 1-like n=1 Tax=Pelobates fuscus TaxID=191477 RepID=UPI002FE4B8B5
MFLSQGLLTWTLLLSVLAGSVSSLQTVNGAVGGSANLTVNLTLPPPEILQATWIFNTNSLIVSLFPGNTIIYTDAYRGRCELLPDLTLRLDKLTLAAQGDYTLTVTDPASGNKTTVTVYLAVYKPFDKMPTLTVSESFPANGSNVNLTCNAPGQTVENYTFYRNQVNACSQDHVTCTGSNLTFHPITESDEGNYTCTIQNPINNKTSEPYLLTVAVPVHEVMIGRNTSSLLWVGKDSVSLNCSALGTDVQFSWNLNGAALPSDPRYKFTHDSLIISPVERNDNGSFTCIARNRVNNITSEALTLSLAWHPEGSIKCSANGNNENVQLLCSWPGGNPPANINMTFNSSIQNGINEVAKNVSLIPPSSDQKLSCYGAQGGLEVACSLTLAKPYVYDFKNYSTTPVVEGNSATLTVTLTGNTVGINSRALIPEAKILPATFTWFHLNPNPTPVSEGVVSTPSTSSLRLSSVTERENGTYECRAENLIGSTSFFYIIHVEAKTIPHPSNGLGPGEIAGIVIGVLAGLAIIGIIIYFIVKGNKKKAKAQSVGLNGSGDQTGTTEYAVINRNRTNGGIAETSITDMPQDNKDDVQYAALRFQNQESVKPIIPTVPETEYSTVKNTLQK